MATKDYVRRPQKRKPKNTQKQTVPWLRIVFAVLLIALFIFALYTLQKTPIEDKEAATSSNQSANAETLTLEQSADPSNTDTSTVSPESIGELPEELAPLPVFGEEDWAYIDSLPEFSVEVDATGPVESDKEYIMQCGSFRTSARAEELKAKIAFQGFESRIIASDGSNGRWYRVVLGPYERKRKAEKDRHQLRRGNVNGCKIW